MVVLNEVSSTRSCPTPWMEVNKVGQHDSLAQMNTLRVSASSVPSFVSQSVVSLQCPSSVAPMILDPYSLTILTARLGSQPVRKFF